MQEGKLLALDKAEAPQWGAGSAGGKRLFLTPVLLQGHILESNVPELGGSFHPGLLSLIQSVILRLREVQQLVQGHTVMQ